GLSDQQSDATGCQSSDQKPRPNPQQGHPLTGLGSAWTHRGEKESGGHQNCCDENTRAAEPFPEPCQGGGLCEQQAEQSENYEYSGMSMPRTEERLLKFGDLIFAR